jgi:hypothetical protein
LDEARTVPDYVEQHNQWLVAIGSLVGDIGVRNPDGFGL